MKSILNAFRMLFALRCQESTQLVSDEFDRPLTRVEWWAIRLHRVSCTACRRFARQLVVLQEAVRLRAERQEKLSAIARKRIQESIRDLQS